MLILDTDHLSELDRETELAGLLLTRLRQSSHQVATTIVSVEEQLRGFLALINKPGKTGDLVLYYARFQRCLTRTAEWRILPWDAPASAEFEKLRNLRVRAGTNDLRIASIAISNNATLLSRNIRDFRRFPNLRVENWLIS